VLWPPDARLTYPLAALGRPGLTLDEWRKTLTKKSSRDQSKLLIGISNAAGCIIAVLHWNGFAFDTLASVPAMMMDEALVRHVAADMLGAHASDSAGKTNRFDTDQG
jgi:hypothetical protein